MAFAVPAPPSGGGGGGGGGVPAHNALSGRSTYPAHPTSALSHLEAGSSTPIDLQTKVRAIDESVYDLSTAAERGVPVAVTAVVRALDDETGALLIVRPDGTTVPGNLSDFAPGDTFLVHDTAPCRYIGVDLDDQAGGPGDYVAVGATDGLGTRAWVRPNGYAALTNPGPWRALTIDHTVDPADPYDVLTITRASLADRDRATVQVHRVPGGGTTTPSHVEVDCTDGMPVGVRIDVLPDAGEEGGSIAQRVPYGLPAIAGFNPLGYTLELLEDYTIEVEATDWEGNAIGGTAVLPAGTYADPGELVMTLGQAVADIGLIIGFGSGYIDERFGEAFHFHIRTPGGGELATINVVGTTGDGLQLEFDPEQVFQGETHEHFGPVGIEEGPGFGWLGHPLVDPVTDPDDPEQVGLGTHWSANAAPDEVLHAAVQVLGPFTHPDSGRFYHRWVKWADAQQRLGQMEAPQATPANELNRSWSRQAGEMADSKLGNWGAAIDAMLMFGTSVFHMGDLDPMGSWLPATTPTPIDLGTFGMVRVPFDHIIAGFAFETGSLIEDTITVALGGPTNTVLLVAVQLTNSDGYTYASRFLRSNPEDFATGPDQDPSAYNDSGDLGTRPLPAWMGYAGDFYTLNVTEVNGVTAGPVTTSVEGLRGYLFVAPRLGNAVNYPDPWPPA